MAVALVTSVTAQSSSGNGVTTATFDSTGADLIVVTVTFYGSADPTVSDSKSNTWSTTTVKRNGTNTGVMIFYAFAATVGASHTVSAAGGTIYQSIAVRAYSSGHASAPLDQQNGGNQSNTNVMTGSITPAENNELVIAGEAHDSTGTISSVDVLTINHNLAGTAFAEGLCVASEIQTTATARNCTFTAGVSDSRAAKIVSFKEAAAAGSIVPIIMALKRQRAA